MTNVTDLDQSQVIENYRNSGKPYVLYSGLLALAHAKNVQGIETELLQVPDISNGDRAIVRAVVTDEFDGRWTGLGDADPENVGRNISPHVIRMAETRAKARALRDMLNVDGMVDESDMGDEAEPAREAPREVVLATEEQVERLTALAIEWRGDSGPDKLEDRLGKPLMDLTREEAIEWIGRLERR